MLHRQVTWRHKQNELHDMQARGPSPECRFLAAAGVSRDLAVKSTEVGSKLFPLGNCGKDFLKRKGKRNEEGERQTIKGKRERDKRRRKKETRKGNKKKIE